MEYYKVQNRVFNAEETAVQVDRANTREHSALHEFALYYCCFLLGLFHCIKKNFSLRLLFDFHLHTVKLLEKGAFLNDKKILGSDSEE